MTPDLPPTLHRFRAEMVTGIERRRPRRSSHPRRAILVFTAFALLAAGTVIAFVLANHDEPTSIRTEVPPTVPVETPTTTVPAASTPTPMIRIQPDDPGMVLVEGTGFTARSQVVLINCSLAKLADPQRRPSDRLSCDDRYTLPVTTDGDGNFSSTVAAHRYLIVGAKFFDCGAPDAGGCAIAAAEFAKPDNYAYAPTPTESIPEAPEPAVTITERLPDRVRFRVDGLSLSGEQRVVICATGEDGSFVAERCDYDAAERIQSGADGSATAELPVPDELFGARCDDGLCGIAVMATSYQQRSGFLPLPAVDG